MVEQQKPLEGGSWTVSALYLQGISLVRRNNEWHHFDPLGTAQVITNHSAGLVSIFTGTKTFIVWPYG